MMPLDQWKTLAEAIQGLATGLGLLAAGLWSYLLFVRRRQRFPRAELRHAVAVLPVSLTHSVIHVKATLRNIGDVLIRVVSAKVRVGQVLPFSPEFLTKLQQGCDLVLPNEGDIKWPNLGLRECSWPEPCEIEPGESDDFDFDFVVESRGGLVEVYSYFQNAVKSGKKIGWRHTSFTSLEEVQQGRPD